MKSTKTISSLNNPVVKNIIALRKNKKRKEQNKIVIEGKVEIERAIKADFNISSLLVCESLLSKNDNISTDKAVLYKTDLKVMRKLSYRENPSPYIAIAGSRKSNLEDVLIRDDMLVVVLEAIEKPGNLGAILRTAEASGVDAVIINDKRVDIFNPNVIRASLGIVFSLPVIISNIKETVTWLNKNKIEIFITTPQAKNIYYKEDYKKSTAIVIGTEHEGLSDDWLGQANNKILIPMRGGVDSLNASVSAALLMYEVVRQRAA